jgi:hypothetical protein
LSAVPKMAQLNDKYGTLTLTHLGIKGSGLATADCW